MKLAIIIPCYNHGILIESVLINLNRYAEGCPIFVVDDASDEATATRLRSLRNQYGFTLSRHEVNRGKGGAVKTALSLAHEAGFTHALQVDADGQHDLGDVPKLQALATRHPRAIISAWPQYGADVPKARLYGRYLTHACVWLETLSFKIKDSMCGFRLYPLSETLQVIAVDQPGDRMDFDTAIMVYYFWAHQGSHADDALYFLPSKVIYPEEGISHFDVLHDNVSISKMHTSLLLQLILRAPRLLCRRWRAHHGR